MTKKIRLTMANDLKEFMEMAAFSDHDIGVHTTDHQVADAKSILGLMALNYDEPILVVTEDEAFLRKLEKWAADE